jgi:hypothetical protein
MSMSIQLVSMVFAAGPSKSTDRFVLLALANYADENGQCWPSVARVGRDVAMSASTVREAIRRLEVDGWLSTREGGATDERIPTGKRPNLYTLRIAEGTDCRCPPGSGAHRMAAGTPPDGGVPPHREPVPIRHSEEPSDEPSVSAPPARGSLLPAVARTPGVNGAWSREACDAWMSRYGGTAPGGQIGKALKPLVERHGWPDVLPAWLNYLMQTDAQYASPARFASTYGQWAGTRRGALTDGEKLSVEVERAKVNGELPDPFAMIGKGLYAKGGVA